MNALAAFIVATTGLLTAIGAIVRSAKKDQEAREKAAAAKEEAQRLDATTARKDYVEQGFRMMQIHAENQATEIVQLKQDNRRCEERYDRIQEVNTELRIAFARMEATVEAMKSPTATVHVPVSLAPMPTVTDTPAGGIPATPGA